MFFSLLLSKRPSKRESGKRCGTQKSVAKKEKTEKE